MQELKALAQSIIDTNNPDWNGLLSDAQLLYERLLILNYLREENLIDTVVEKTETENPEPQSQTVAPAKSVEEPKQVAPEPTPQPIAEEPPKEEPKPESVAEKKPEIPPIPEPKPILPPEVTAEKRPDPIFEAVDPKPRSKASLNDRLAVGQIQMGLNDRIAFVKHLFNGEQGDFNRVLSQLNTFEQLSEAENFIEQMVKPDYDWSQKEEFEMRFYDLVRQKFGEEN